MTEFSTNNDIKHKAHLSQPLQNSPRHINNYNYHQQHQNSPQHFVSKHFTQPFKQIHQNNHQDTTFLPLNNTANISNINNALTTTASNSSPTSTTHSPLRYKNPLNSPNNSPFSYAYNYGGNAAVQQHNYQQQQKTRAARNATLQQHQHQQQLQQQLRNHKLSHLTQTQYQQHLNDTLAQQQQLQLQQNKLLSTKNADNDDELSEESLKQNVAIVLNNLERYNNALRSIILNEQVSDNSIISNSSVCFREEDGDDGDGDCNLLLNSSNNNFMLSNNAMAAAAAITPESDYNSNATTPGSRSNMLPLDCNISLQQQQQQQQQHLLGFGNGTACGAGGFATFGNNVASNNLNCSFASSHDFSHDNSDYQWFLDYGYRDGCSGMQRSVLSSLSASYNGIGDLIYYEDLAKNMDANLAEADMESFRTEDIHSLLSHLPSYCKSLGSNNRLQQSLILHQQQQQQQHLNMLPAIASHHHGHHNISQTSTTSTNELIDNSICKSELLFSPVKESHISVDSLDMDAYPEDGDIILTCQANKDNYTIAFEGSVMYSDESFYAEPNEIAMMNQQNFINLHSNLEDIVKRKSLDVSMSRSEQAFTARSCRKLQKDNATQLQRYPSGNNNTSDAVTFARHTTNCLVRKSSSLPDLVGDTRENSTINQNNQEEQLNVSQTADSNTTIDSYKSRNLLPMCQMPISISSTSVSISERLATQCQVQQQQLQQQPQQHRHKHRCCCNNTASSAVNNHNNACAAVGLQQQKHAHAHISGSASSGNSNPPAFNLVKLFIKQKSSNSSSENQANSQTCMDVSSGCWPSSDAAASSSNSSSSLEQRMRKKSMNDSGKGSALSRHDEEDLLREREGETAENTFPVDNVENVEYSKPKRHLRACTDAVFYDDERSSSSAGSMTANNSPAHRRRSMPLRNPQICQLATNKHHNADSLQSSDGSRSNSEQLTQVYLSTGSNGVPLRKNNRHAETSRTVSSSETVTRSMQTSCGTLSSRSSLSDRFRCVPPSFLEKLNNLGEEKQAPIYVIYPNYALPDLGFVTTHSSSTDVIFSPFNYKMAVNSGNGDNNAFKASLKDRLGLSGNEDEILNATDFKHVVDWQSLVTLLPIEYRRRLKHIPEVNKILRSLESELSQRPLFCRTPSVPSNRSNLDSANFFQQQKHTAAQSNLPPQAGEEGSSSSGSSQQPSSGYRGSSTLLTDSELDTCADPLKQMYVYQYEQQRMDSGIETSPTQKSERRTPPHPMPRGILRKSVSHSGRTKRNSMIENQQTKLSKLEKRRSLQEPAYHEEFYEVFEEEAELHASPPSTRLSRKDLDARARAENFLSSLPRSELKYYAEIAAILESSEHQVHYDAVALKKEVSRALSQQKKVSFNDAEEQRVAQQNQILQANNVRMQRFSTPPNSPNISMASGGGGGVSGLRTNGVQRHRSTSMEEKDQRKIESNRFKRLQIQWELMSKDSSMLKELANEEHTKSGGSTPTSATAAHKSRIPRPVSYPAGKRTESPKKDIKTIERSLTSKPACISPQITRIISKDHRSGKTARSPSRIVPPKRYSMATSPALVTPPSTKAITPTNSGTTKTTTPTFTTTPTTSRARTPTNRNAVTAPSTPKRRVQSPRTSRVR